MSAILDKPVSPAAEDDGCPECLMGNLNWLLTQAHYALASELATALEPLDISPRGGAVLSAAMTGAHTQKELAGLVGLDKTTMVATLDELEAAGLAKRVPSPTDRRARVVEVTRAGGAKVQKANEIVAVVQADVLSSLGGEDAGDALVDALAKLVSSRLGESGACKGVRRREPRGRVSA
jgi:MarR family transcriptional regulator for hemolysin